MSFLQEKDTFDLIRRFTEVEPTEKEFKNAVLECYGLTDFPYCCGARIRDVIRKAKKDFGQDYIFALCYTLYYCHTMKGMKLYPGETYFYEYSGYAYFLFSRFEQLMND